MKHLYSTPCGGGKQPAPRLCRLYMRYMREIVGRRMASSPASEVQPNFS